MQRDIINSAQAPAAVGAYEQAIAVAGALRTLYCSGQIALDPETGSMVGGGDVAQETHQVLKNLGAVLAQAGMGVQDLVRATIYLTDMENFSIVNEIYAAWVGDTPPARACVAVSGLPRGAVVEIDAIAVQ